MEYRLKIGKTEMPVEVSDENLIAELKTNQVEVKLTGEDEVRRALAEPVASAPLSEIVKPNDKIVIITSDITRPMPSKITLPPVLDELYKAGCKDENITIIFGMGIHRHHTVDERKYLVGEEVYNKIKCIDSDPNDYKRLGVTPSGTPVDIFTPVAEADKVICLGNIEYHYFAGYSGGAKAIMPGVSTRDAIQANHKRMVETLACAGNITTNPVREDIDSVANYLKIHFIVNVVLDSKKQIIKAVAGDFFQAHREGCKFLDSLFKVSIPEKADIVITSPAGYPKDINLYQGQKALDNAKHAVKDGGIIILVASCAEEWGEDVFEEWILEAKKPSDLTDRIKKDFQLVGHKAAAIAMIMEFAQVYMVSDMPDEKVKQIFMKPFKTLEEAYAAAKVELGENAKVILMPNGGSTLPYLK